MGAGASTAHLSATQKTNLVADVEEQYKMKANCDRLVDLDKLKSEFIGSFDDAVSVPLGDLLDDVAEKIPEELSTALAEVDRTIAPLPALPLSASTPLPTLPLQKKMNTSHWRSPGFRERRLTFTKSRPSLDAHDEEDTSNVFCQAREFGTAQSREPPFPGHIVGTFSCHGIEPSSNADGVASKINQDRGSFTYPFAGDENQALFCVFDGHGKCGDVVSHVVMLEMQERLAAALQKSDDPPAALEKVFIEIDEALPQLVGPNTCQNSGTTAVVVLLRGTHCWVAHLGDSRAVVGSSCHSQLPVKELTHDHKCDDPTEHARIIAAGGFVRPRPAPDLSARVYTDAALTRVGLAMSRAFGDYCVKDFGVICKPTIAEFELIDEDSFPVLASDGVCVRDRSVVSVALAGVGRGLSSLCTRVVTSREPQPPPVPFSQVRVPLVAGSRRRGRRGSGREVVRRGRVCGAGRAGRAFVEARGG